MYFIIKMFSKESNVCFIRWGKAQPSINSLSQIFFIPYKYGVAALFKIPPHTLLVTFCVKQIGSIIVLTDIAHQIVSAYEFSSQIHLQRGTLLHSINQLFLLTYPWRWKFNSSLNLVATSSFKLDFATFNQTNHSVRMVVLLKVLFQSLTHWNGSSTLMSRWPK